MDTERLQEIKDKLLRLGTDGERLVNDRWIEMYAKELITALEVCKNNLSLAIDRDIATQKALESSDEKLVNAQAELAVMTEQFEDAARIATEAQAEASRCNEKLLDMDY